MVGRVGVPEGVLTRIVDGELVVLNLETEQYYGLDAIATQMWTALISTSSTDAAVDALHDKYDVDRATLELDLDGLIEQLVARRLLVLEDL